MRTSDVIAKARELVAGGWSEPMSLTVAGHICTAQDEGIASYCLVDALEVAAQGDVPLAMRAEHEVTTQLRVAGHGGGLSSWLEANGRELPEVVRLLARAHAHAVAGESR